MPVMLTAILMTVLVFTAVGGFLHLIAWLLERQQAKMLKPFQEKAKARRVALITTLRAIKSGFIPVPRVTEPRRTRRKS
jgi:hypothetical protein